MSDEIIPLQVVGGGPAGMSLVLALCNRISAGEDDAPAAGRLLDSLRLFEAGPHPGGKMAHYRVNANTNSRDAVDGIADGTPFAVLRDRYLAHPETRSELIPLARVGALIVEPLAAAIGALLGERLQCDTPVSRIEIGDGCFTSHDDGGRALSRSRNLLLCCGAVEKPLPDLESRAERWEGSGKFLLRDSLDGLPRQPGPIVIVGASHSAFSCAWRLLYDPLLSPFGKDREIVVLQRRERIKLRCTPEFAAAHGIDYDSRRDVCPRTGLVFRHGGLRKDAKQLYLDLRDGRETRVRLVQMNSLDQQRELLDSAALILQATGFGANLPRLERGAVPLEAGAPTVDGELCEPPGGKPIPGLYGMGLGLDILPPGPARGEASFGGGVHGFQSYPLAIAPRIIARIIAGMSRGTGH
jgi:hypothetical protein